MTAPRVRSVLFLPASNSRAIAKARTLACDAVVLDLEDAVAPELKAEARAAAVAALREGEWRAPLRVVRVNGLDTEWAAADLEAVRACDASAVLAPKVDSAHEAKAYVEALGATPLWCMIETPGAVLRLDAIAGAGGVAALVLGTNDLAKSLRAAPGADRAPLQPAMSLIVAAARAHGRLAIDGVFNAIDDAEGLAAECAQARAWGFDGKSLIHPSQIEPCHAAFAPAPDEVRRAQAVVAAFAAPEAQGRGAIKVEGRMVERLHLEEAQQTLRLAAEA